MEGDKVVTKDNWSVVRGKNVSVCKAEIHFAYEPIREDTPLRAYRRVLRQVAVIDG